MSFGIHALRRQVEAEAEARLDQSKAKGQPARLVATQGAISGGEHTDRYSFEITNVGPAAVFNPRAWAAGDGVGTPVMSEVVIASVLLAESVKPFHIDIPRAASDAGGLSLWMAWTDDAGEQMKPLLNIRKLR